ncbi:lateral signaling target protein 2 homolog isoform X2 [Cephus cinctus]|uniref:Lateral signaling target protein 2 homolog isoform X2 n=1 Tax=Cephus cinctus TaxID=211228 RepID=A0AAJ7RLU3_CEPCN|nr:lateral signaling target protein 2 homolog isoform X2 [Cephus cinctus]
MSWTNRMALYGSERSLHSLSAQSPQPGRTLTPAPVTSTPKSTGRNPPINSSMTGGTPGSTLGKQSYTTSAGDSRIPRPSPTPLRRSTSMRMSGEEISYLRPTAASSARHHHHHNQHSHHHLHQQFNQLDHFPVITENGSESPRHRSFSLSLTPARPRLGNTASGTGADDSDAESVKSYGSACSTASACDHAHFALNGTTWSGRSRKYVVHCANYNGDGDQYLTPTQRAARQVRKFQALLKDARREIEEKDKEIFRLTKEVVELRLYKASLNSPDERTDSSDALTVRENNALSPESPCKDLPDEGAFEASANPETPDKNVSSDLPSSLADSGHFEDGSIHSKESVCLPGSTSNGQSTTTSTFSTSRAAVEHDEERRRLVALYESRIEEMHRRHIDEIQELKEKHNDKVESLLTQFAEVNNRYCEVRPAMDAAEARTRELESEVESLKTEISEQKKMLDEQEERNKTMYLKMYAKGQEAARIEHADQILEQAHQAPSKVSVAELLQQLTVTQAELENVKAMYRRIVESRSSQGALDPEITLQFLKSAVYYFLTDKENHHGHLNAIESILGFSDAEKLNIDRIYRSARK